MSPFKARGSREQTLHEIAAFFFTTCSCLWVSDPCRREQHRNRAHYSEIQVNLELLPRHLARGAGKSKWPGNGWIHSLGMFLLLSSWTIAATGTFHVSMGASLFFLFGGSFCFLCLPHYLVIWQFHSVNALISRNNKARQVNNIHYLVKMVPSKGWVIKY